VPTNVSNPNLNGPTISLSGLFYAPGASNMIYNNQAGTYFVLVVGAANFNNGANDDLATPPPNGSIVQKAMITQ
jgi:hypothetical protein